MRNYLVTAMTWCGLGLVLVATGCGSNYYKVSDPATGRSFYSNKGEANGQGGNGEV
jgi:hypothetical protein